MTKWASQGPKHHTILVGREALAAGLEVLGARTWKVTGIPTLKKFLESSLSSDLEASLPPEAGGSSQIMSMLAIDPTSATAGTITRGQ
jgi:hypothetical protein